MSVFFSKLCDEQQNSKLHQKEYLVLGNLGKIDDLVNFIIFIEKYLVFSVFLVRGKSEKIESIHFGESSGLSC